MTFLGLAIFLIGDQWRSSQGNLNSFGICLIEIWQVGTTFIVGTVGFIDKIDILTIEVITRAVCQIWIILKLLDIDHSHIIAVLFLIEFSRVVDALHLEPSFGKFLKCLVCQVQTIDDKVKLRNDSLFWEIVGQIADIEESQGSLTWTLGMPDNSLLDSFCDRFFNSTRRKILRIAHHVLLQLHLPILALFFDIDQTKAKHKEQAFLLVQGR